MHLYVDQLFLTASPRFQGKSEESTKNERAHTDYTICKTGVEPCSSLAHRQHFEGDGIAAGRDHPGPAAVVPLVRVNVRPRHRMRH